MTNEAKYKELVNSLCEFFGFSKPFDILRLCQITTEFIQPYEARIKELETENQHLSELLERTKKCSNCKHFSKTYELCRYSLGDEDYSCRGRKWEPQDV